MRKCAFGLVVVSSFLGLVSSRAASGAAYVPASGFTRVPQTFAGDVFAMSADGKVAVAANNFSGNASVNVYSSVAAAAANASPIRTFTSAGYKAWGDLTFADNDTLLFSENGGAANADAVYKGVISTGATTPLGNVPNAGGVVAVGSTAYAVAANDPGTGTIYSLSLFGGGVTPVISNIGTGYLSGIAVDSSGNLLLTDTNDPTFVGNPGILRRYTSTFSPLSSISLAGGNGSGAYDVVLDTEGDAFVTTGSTITQIPHATTVAQQFGSTFTGFPFVTNLDYIGSGFEPNAGVGKLWVNAVFSDDGSIFGITPIPEPAAGAIVSVAAISIMTRRRRRVAVVAASLAAIAWGFVAIQPARADHFYATQVVDRAIGTQQQAGFTDPTLALGGPRGGGTTSASTDVYNLGNGGSITLGFDVLPNHYGIFNGPGADFIVSENAFYRDDDPMQSFAEMMWVEVSSDGSTFARFPAYSATPDPVGAFGVIDPFYVSGFAGVMPVMADVGANALDPFDPAAAGGDAFDLDALANDPLVVGGQVNPNRIRYVRLVDVIGDGSAADPLGRPIYDPTGPGIGGADVDSIAVVNGTHMPEPSATMMLPIYLLSRYAGRGSR